MLFFYKQRGVLLFGSLFISVQVFLLLCFSLCKLSSEVKCKICLEHAAVQVVFLCVLFSVICQDSKVLFSVTPTFFLPCKLSDLFLPNSYLCNRTVSPWLASPAWLIYVFFWFIIKTYCSDMDRWRCSLLTLIYDVWCSVLGNHICCDADYDLSNVWWVLIHILGKELENICFLDSLSTWFWMFLFISINKWCSIFCWLPCRNPRLGCQNASPEACSWLLSCVGTLWTLLKTKGLCQSTSVLGRTGQRGILLHISMEIFSEK